MGAMKSVRSRPRDWNRMSTQRRFIIGSNVFANNFSNPKSKIGSEPRPMMQNFPSSSRSCLVNSYSPEQCVNKNDSLGELERNLVKLDGLVGCLKDAQ
jgi:hypothetical protein